MSLVKLSEEGDGLYTDLLTDASNSPEGLKKLFYQSDIKRMADASAKTLDALLRLIQELVSHRLLRTSRMSGALCWSTRPRAAAEAIASLPTNEMALYEYVEESHTKGIWLRELKKRSGIEEKKVEKCMAKLESARLVKLIKNIKAPAQKTYMLFHLVPSDDVTGGSFFDGGDLDEGLIEEVGNLVIFHVRQESWQEDRKIRRRRRRGSSADYTNGYDGKGEGNDATKKRKRSTDDIEDGPSPTRYRRSPDQDTTTTHQIPHPAGIYFSYPTAHSIHAFITSSSALRASKASQLTVAEIQGVLDVLVWDDKLEKLGSGYRTVRGVSFRPPGFGGGGGEDSDEEDGGSGRIGNGLTQVPCGSCPVFELCGSEGRISARSCVYFKEWLEGEA
ncbi:hypothetical protein LTR62_005710 [Meristemomyces frigidus]|uniref:DNA-directed RNA polymerase III subunit RPC6 n=1 Tax=Meristemomyces frigidus TaxID=1508187 RepID=A0AAN7TCR0_9PEZI|nr:hypothetical protein LTR62_005710 [Meristemomyces frigidus]